MLDLLPVEILLQIISYMSCSAAVCFALASHLAHELVGDQPFKDLRSLPENANTELPLFRSLLAHDLPDWHYCPRCRSLHPTFGSEGPGVPHRQKAAEKDWLHRRFFGTVLPCHEHDQVHFPDGYFLTWRDVHLAMKRHRYGPAHGIPLRNLCARDSKPFPTWAPLVSGQTFEACISNGRLRLKRESRFTVPRATQTDEPLPVRRPPGCTERKIWIAVLRASFLPQERFLFPHPRHVPDALIFALCLHLRVRVDCLRGRAAATDMVSTLQLLQLHERVQCVLAHSPGQAVGACQDCQRAPNRCPACGVQYSIRRDGDAIVVTGLYDFGQGMSPADPDWRRHQQNLMSVHLSLGQSASLGPGFFKGLEPYKMSPRFLARGGLENSHDAVGATKQSQCPPPTPSPQPSASRLLA